MHEKLRHRLLGWWAGLVCDHPWAVLLATLIVAAAAVYLTVDRLTFQPDRNALISTDLEWNQRYIDYREAFSFDDMIAVIEVPDEPGGRARARRYADALADELRDADEHVRRVIWRIDTRATSPAAVRMLGWPEFRKAMHRMAAARALLEATNLADVMGVAPAELSRQHDGMDRGEAIANIEIVNHLIDAVGRSLEGEPTDAIRAELTAVAGPRYRYLASADGRLLFMQLEPRLSTDQLDPVRPAVDAVRAAMDRVRQRVPDVEAGLTGVSVIEADETEVTQRDATLATILAVGVIALVMIVAFHSVHLPLLIVSALWIGVAWSFGFVTLGIGHLQLLSVTFTVMLLGLGVDFGIHLVSRFELVRDQYPSGPPGFRQAMIDAMQTMGPGIVTGALTTAVAFGTMLLTDFQGMAEMGLIAGVGIVLCLLAMFSALPALMRLIRPRRRHIKPVHQRRLNLYEHHWWTPFYRRPAITILVVVALVAIAGFGVRHVRYDYNLSNLLPRDIESVRWFDRLNTAPNQQADTEHSGGEFNRSIWFGASIIEADGNTAAAMDLARRRTEAFRDKPTVAGLGGVAELFPPQEAQRRQLIRETRDALGPALAGPMPESEPADPDEMTGTLSGLLWAARAAQKRDEVERLPDIARALAELERHADRVADLLADTPPDLAAARLVRLNRAFADWRAGLRDRIDRSLTTRDLTLSDLPAPVRRTAVGGPGNDQLLLQVYPRLNVYDPDNLARFVSDLRQVDPNVTGTVIQIHESSDLMVRAYIKAGLLALIAVFCIVLIDFQKPADALLCLVPVGLAFVLLLGIMGANDLPINPANIIVLPLLFGIGVDSGVHILHRYRQAPHEHPPGLAAGTGKGIMLTSTTTALGFACLMIADHRGIASLGFTLTLGMILTLLACLTVMPSVLELRSRNRQRRASKAASLR